MILEDKSEVEVGGHWEINIPCVINIERSDENLKRWSGPNFVGLDLTREQAEQLCKEIQNTLNNYDYLEKLLEEAHAKSNTNE